MVRESASGEQGKMKLTGEWGGTYMSYMTTTASPFCLISNEAARRECHIAAPICMHRPSILWTHVVLEDDILESNRSSRQFGSDSTSTITNSSLAVHQSEFLEHYLGRTVLSRLHIEVPIRLLRV